MFISASSLFGSHLVISLPFSAVTLELSAPLRLLSWSSFPTFRKWLCLAQYTDNRNHKRKLSQFPSTKLTWIHPTCLFLFLFFFKDFMYLFLETGEGKEKERERSISVWLPLTRPPSGTWPHSPGMCPDWESNQWPFVSQAGTQSTEPHQPGLLILFFSNTNTLSSLLIPKHQY